MLKLDYRTRALFTDPLSPKLYYDRIETPKGVFSVLFSSSGLFRICFPGRDLEQKYLHQLLPWKQLSEDLNRYLAGELVDWDRYPLDTRGYRPFTAAVLEEVRRIPYGRVSTYRESAERAGYPLAWRAAGQALKANRHPILVPCHRVIASGGKLGGFSGPAGWKQMLLKIEAGKDGGGYGSHFNRQ